MSDYDTNNPNTEHNETPSVEKAPDGKKPVDPRVRTILIVLGLLVLLGVLIIGTRSCSSSGEGEVPAAAEDVSFDEPALYVVENKESVNGKFFVHVRRHGGDQRYIYQVSRAEYDAVEATRVYARESMVNWERVSKAE